MQTTAIDGIRLDFETRGTGEPVVLIHGSAIADSYVPILCEPSLAGFRLVRYRRRGYGGSTHSEPPVSIARQAADCAALMRRLDIERAHVVGHSYGGAIAMQLAIDFPSAVHSLSLLEPALVFKTPSRAALAESFAPIAAKCQGGDKSGAIDGFMRLVEGSDWRKAIDPIAGAWQMAIADADTVFQLEGQALQEWPFGVEDARRIKVPVLAMLGAGSVPIFHETHELACSWFAHSEPVVIRGATHMLQMVKPRAVAEALSGFLSRHPIRA